MIIIFEGAERTGKTLAAKELEKRGFVYFKDTIHYQNMRPETIQGRQDTMLNFISECYKNNIDVVIDRFFISERVYGRNYRSTPEENLSYTYYIEKALSNMNVKLVLFERDVDDKYVEQHPICTTKDNLRKIVDKFYNEWDKSEIRDKYKVNLKYIFEGSYLNYDSLNAVLSYVIGQGEVKEEEKEVVLKKNVKVHEAFNYDFYLASPFFNEIQIKRMEFILKSLRDFGYKVYAPYEHGIVKPDENKNTVSEIFKSNVDAIDSCEMVIAITDGKDMGTIWEAGYAYGKNKPVVYYAETLGDNPFNIMLSESAVGIFTDREMFKEALLRGTFTTTKDGILHE